MATNINRQPSLDEIRELLSPYLDGEVTEEERLWVEQAIATSAELRQELESLRQMVDLLAAMPPMAAPRPFTLSEADVEPISPPVQKRSFWGSKWFGSLAMTAAALACVVIVGWALFTTQLSPVPQEVAVSSQAENAPAAPTLAQAVPEVEQEAASAAREEASAAEPMVEEEAPATEADEEAAAEQPEIALAPPAEEETAGAAGEAAADQAEEEMAAAQAVEEAAEEAAPAGEEMTTTQAVEEAAEEAAPAEEEIAAAQAVEEAAEGQEAPASEGRTEITSTQDTTERMTAPAPAASPTPVVETFSQEATVLPTPPPQPEEAADAAAAEVAPSLKSAPEAAETTPEEGEAPQLLVEPEGAQEEATQELAYSEEQATATLAPAPTATPQPSPTTVPAPATPAVAPTAGVDDLVAGETETPTGITSWLIAGAVLLALLVLGAIIWSKVSKR